MKKSNIIQLENNTDKFLFNFDRREIDNPDIYNLFRINYIRRIEQIVKSVEKFKYPPAKVLEIGCAQANISLLLAEKGYDTYALDLRYGFLKYSKKKYEKGNINWIQGNAFELPFNEFSFDIIIMAEFVEHVAFPEYLIRYTWKFITNGGLLLITTPNGDNITNELPHISNIKERNELRKKQFQPEGLGHLFSLTEREIQTILKNLTDSYGGKTSFAGSILLNNYTYKFYNKIYYPLLLTLIKFIEVTPCLRNYFSKTLMVKIFKREKQLYASF